MKREAGYYWVKDELEGPWEVWLWVPDDSSLGPHWLSPGWEVPIRDYYGLQVGGPLHVPSTK